MMMASNVGDAAVHNITSPRKLQEMSLPVPESHDITTASGVSLKQYEEQLNGLRKENFHLKLRVYFLEEKLGDGSPPAVQGLLEHNVRLQVEVEELRRQLSDKQELLAAAAEAIDVLEQQGSMSADSIEASMNFNTTINKESHEQNNENIEQTGDDTCQEVELIGDTVDKTSFINPELNELSRKYNKALLVIKKSIAKIKEHEKEIRKLKMVNVGSAEQNDQTAEKYEEILKCKNDHIKDLESKVKELQTNVDNGSNENAGNLQELLTHRLQALAYFLDKLLSHRCVLGEDRKKLAESILEQSLALGVDLQLDESMAPDELTMDESNLDITQPLRIEDLTLMFGHHVSCHDGLKSTTKKQTKANILSESECWSEPDRNVSLARMGLAEMVIGGKESTSDNNRLRTRRSRLSHGSRCDEVKRNNEQYLEEISQLHQRIEHFELVKQNLSSELVAAKEQIEHLLNERNDLRASLEKEKCSVQEINESKLALKQKLFVMETRQTEVEHQVANATETSERLRAEKQDLEATFLETERSLKRAADEATVQASQAALERARAQHDRLRVERELEETREKLSSALDAHSLLQLQISSKLALEANNKLVVHDAPLSEEDRPTSPDQGIDSDRLSSLENNESRSPRSLYEENQLLKQKLARTKATLADTLTQINAANIRKRSVQRAICREIHKTNGVLRQARDQFESQADDIQNFKEL